MKLEYFIAGTIVGVVCSDPKNQQTIKNVLTQATGAVTDLLAKGDNSEEVVDNTENIV